MGTFGDHSGDEHALREFDSAWADGELHLGDFVEKWSPQNDTLLKLVELDLRRRWDNGDHTTIEQYLEQFPRLANLDDGIIRLIAAEQESRRKNGGEVAEAEYRSRFPEVFIGESRSSDDTDNVEAFPETIARRKRANDSPDDSNPETDGTIIGDFKQPRESVSATPPASSVPDSDKPAPNAAPLKTIDRYRIKETLGRGGGGVVYRAFDDHLDRDVAIKVPHGKVLGENPDLAREYRHEARVVAQLDHDHIIRIYDVNSTDSVPCYLVTQFIKGQALSSLMRDGGMTTDESIGLVAAMADALQHAHSQGVVHRDVKPGNILVDDSGKPWLADFGLALDDDTLPGQGEYAGTPSYMSPEQASGEGHRIDGRSDIFSLGIVLYELLTRKRPFPGDTTLTVMLKIRDQDARPLRQLDSNIPEELDRICLKALARQISNRYVTAADLAEDLRLWQQSQQPVDGIAVRTPAPAVPDVDICVVPKGLRSFDGHDASFFLSLLPGARGRDGLPESVRFWKGRIEARDSASTFSVGLVYGPSGCGKSSLIRAGVIPRLDQSVTAVYVEATPEDTEARILHAVKSAIGDDSEEQTLVELFKTVRRNGSNKVVLFIDQFEQWLQPHRDSDTEIVRALRQCDGEQLQAVVMVRDDFWLAASRFMREIDVRINEGDNSNLVDLFPQPHAERVLTLFGQARGDLPQDGSEISDDHRAFVRDAVQSLAQDDKVVCVRLALFAEMMRGKQWLPTTLEKLGGASGIGLTFLEETFSSPSAPIEHRVHQAAARKVLRALLPTAGTQLKGHMLPAERLLHESGYAQHRKGEFDDLLVVLDQQLRLITPTDPLGKIMQEDGSPLTDEPEHGVCYQLTHDYLVPTLREWLYLKQRETRRGRAELLLGERASLWEDRQGTRQFLPSISEWINIRLFTGKKRWTVAERAMVAAADRLHLTRFAIVSAVLLLSTAGLFHLNSTQRDAIAEQQRKNDREKTETLVTIMLGGPGFAFPYTRELVRPFQEYALEDVHARLNAGKLPPSEDLHARLFLADSGNVDSEFIVKAIRNCDSSECPNIVSALLPAKAAALPIIESDFRAAVDRHDMRTASRLAVVALSFGNIAPASELSGTPLRPWPRTLLIKTFSEWNSKLIELANVAAPVDDRSLRSALCLGIGSIKDQSREVKDAWQRVWQKWYVEHPDAGTHSASRWALQSWKLPVPQGLPQGESDQRDWYHSKEQVVLIRIPSGTFSRIDSNLWEPKRHTVEFVSDFWVSDREVSVEQYHEFLKDSAELVGWTNPNASPEHQFADGDPRWPMQSVTWFEAVAFCNWLSEKEKLEPAYILTDRAERAKGVEFTVENQIDANGFRLPTEAEWEYFARAGTSSPYSTGDHRSPLEDYANFGTVSPIICGSLRCNAWGLFDTHGNVMEWCQDKWGRYPDSHVANPQGATDGKSNCYRGGSWFGGRRNCRSEFRKAGLPLEKLHTIGFRVVRNVD